MTVQAGLDDFFLAVPQTPWSLPEGVRVTFELWGEDGGNWTVSSRRGKLSASRSREPHPDCRLRCSTDDFRALLRGEFDARQGFLEGRIEVEGDVGLMLRLARATVTFRDSPPLPPHRTSTR